MCKRLASGSRCRRSLARGGKVGKLSLSLCVLVFDILSNGTWIGRDRRVSAGTQDSMQKVFFSSVKMLTICHRVVSSSGTWGN